MGFVAIKAEAALEAGRPLSWAEFLEDVFVVYQQYRVAVVEMHQDSGPGAEAEVDVVVDEPFTLEMGAALGAPVLLSDETAANIARHLAEQLGPWLARRTEGEAPGESTGERRAT